MQATFAASRASVMTVHLCSTVPFGEHDRSPADSVGLVRGTPQRVRQRRLAAPRRPRREPPGIGHGDRRAQRPPLRREHQAGGMTTMVERIAPPDVTVVTGAAGWLGRALVHHLTRAGGDERPGSVRALVTTPADAEALAIVCRASSRSSATSAVPTDSPGSSPDSAGTVDVLHTAGVIHPARVDDFEEVNARGTANVMAAARAAGVRRVVHVSSNSPFGVNAAPRRHVPQRRALRPVPRLRPLEDAGGAARPRRRRRRRPQRGHRAPALVLRSLPARPPDDVLQAGRGTGASPSSATAASAARWCTSTTSSKASSPPS